MPPAALASTWAPDGMDAMNDNKHTVTRRGFIKASGATAGAIGAAGLLTSTDTAEAANDPGVPDLTEIGDGVDVRYTVCLGCHSKCGIRVRVKDDTILKVDGNPWHPNCAETGERLSFDASLDEALTVTERASPRAVTCCPKGQAGVEAMYNPHRIRRPLERVGPRGAGRWTELSWDEVLDKIADAVRPYYDGGNPDAPVMIATADGSGALGTVANQVAFSPGRIQHGQKEFTDRLWKKGFGTVNSRHDHTSICETSHHVAGAFLTERFAPGQSDVKHHFKPDMLNSDYVIWFGTNPLEANFPGQTLAKRMAKSRNGGVQHVVVDPRHSRSCAFAHRWLAVRPGGDIALAMGIAREIVRLGLQDLTFLEAANNQAGLSEIDWNGAAKDLQYNVTDAGYLVQVQAPLAENEWLFHRADPNDLGAVGYVVVDPETGEAASLDRDADAAAQWGRTELDGTERLAVEAEAVGIDGVGPYVLDVNGDGSVYCAPVFQLYRARLMRHSLDRYARESGIDAATIANVAAEFAAAGRKAVATAYRGACQHTFGVAAMQAILSLNHLVGNWDWRGGNLAATGGHLHEMGGKNDGQLSLGSAATTSRSTSGPQLTRVKKYFDSTLADALGESFDAPTQRPWFPYAYNGNYQETIPSIGQGYPYPTAALFTYWNNLPYSTPAATETTHRILTDESLLPLHVNFDIEMSEMASLADYVLPDGSYFERWSTPHNSPVVLSVFSGFRSPVVGYYANIVGPNGRTFWESVRDRDLHNWGYTIDWANDEGPFTIEDILLELHFRMAGGPNQLDGFGDAAYYADRDAMIAAGVSPSMRNTLRNAWDWYWNILVNFAIEAGVDPNDEAAINEMACRIVERGGWFQDTELDGTNEYDGDYAKNRMKAASKGRALHFFFEYAYDDGHADLESVRP